MSGYNVHLVTASEMRKESHRFDSPEAIAAQMRAVDYLDDIQAACALADCEHGPQRVYLLGGDALEILAA